MMAALRARTEFGFGCEYVQPEKAVGHTCYQERELVVGGGGRRSEFVFRAAGGWSSGEERTGRGEDGGGDYHGGDR